MQPSRVLDMMPRLSRAIIEAERVFFRGWKRQPLTVAFCVNTKMVRPLCVTLFSLLRNNPGKIEAYILTSGLSEKAHASIDALARRYARLTIHFITVHDPRIETLHQNPELNYISRETFYRYLLPDLLPTHERVLYLDCDLLVLGSLRRLWETEFGDNLIAGVRDVWCEDGKQRPELGFTKDEPYINAGVLLMNLAAMRTACLTQRLFEISASKKALPMMDQDAINLACRGHVLLLPSKYNVFAAKKAPRKFHGHPTILHYVGAEKPWHGTIPETGAWRWRAYQTAFEQTTGTPPMLRVGLIIDEFFGGGGTAFGGYGFLARHGIAPLLPDCDITLDVLMFTGRSRRWAQVLPVDGTNLCFLPARRRFRKSYLKRADYDVYLSIEMTHLCVLNEDTHHSRRLLFWIQDPRPQSDWDEIEQVKLFPEPSYWNPLVYSTVHQWFKQGRIRFISQAECLNAKARELYMLPADTPIELVRNPVILPFPEEFAKTRTKKNSIVFLGRIESVKRGWIFCEIAKQMPDLEFHIIGQATRDKARNEALITPYRNLPNLHFDGHREGMEKYELLLDAKILVNTSSHEALPVSFIEALSCGTLLVSNQNPDNLTERFGKWVGPVIGDGFDAVPRFCKAIRDLLADESKRKQRATEAIGFAYAEFNPTRIQKRLRNLVREEGYRYRKYRG